MLSIDVEKLKENGILKIDNFLSDFDLNKSISIIKYLNVLKGDTRGHFSKKLNFLFSKLLQGDFKKIKNTFSFLNLEKKLFLKEIADNFFGEESILSLIDCYISPKSTGDVLPWHLDNAYSGQMNVESFVHPKANSLKFFFYLTDVTSDNGCLSYIAKSHKIAFVLKEGIYNGELKYTPYWHLADFLKTITINQNYNYIKKKLGQNQLDNCIDSVYLATNKKNTNFDVPINKGGVLIFDEAGAHRGSKPMLNDRLALRFLYKRKCY